MEFEKTKHRAKNNDKRGAYWESVPKVMRNDVEYDTLPEPRYRMFKNGSEEGFGSVTREQIKDLAAHVSQQGF